MLRCSECTSEVTEVMLYSAGDKSTWLCVCVCVQVCFKFIDQSVSSSGSFFLSLFEFGI